MDFARALRESLLRTAYFAETHSIKGVLAADRLARRLPGLPPAFFDEALELWQIMPAPRVAGSLRRHVLWDEPFPDERMESTVGRAVFPLAYEAAALWVERRGLSSLVERHRRRAIARLGHLGHSWTIWCSFVEAVPHLDEREDQIVCAERYVELVAAQLAYNDPTRENPDAMPLDGPPADDSATLDAALAEPGFFGHTLITLGWLYRHRARLDEAEWRWASARIHSMIAETKSPAAAALATAAPATTATTAEVEAALVRLVERGPREVHTITFADAALDIAAIATPRQKAHLVAVTDALARWTR